MLLIIYFSIFYILFICYFPWLFSCILNNLTLDNILNVSCYLEQTGEIYFSPPNIIIKEYVFIKVRYTLCYKNIKIP